MKPALPGVPEFKCSKFERYIRKQLNKLECDITNIDMANLLSIGVDTIHDEADRGILNDISDISGIEYCVNLRQLQLNRNPFSDIAQFSDITPLKGLTDLDFLELNVNEISDISPLEGLVQLTRLSLTRNKINSLSPLTKLTKLKELHLGNNQIGDINALKDLDKLESLELGYNQISDISTLMY